MRDLAGGALGEFDYIVAHGLYGWIPQDARDALLATIDASLAPDGIAYVSYNAQPGGYFRRMLRDAGLLARARRRPGDELARAEKAQELYKFLKEQRVTTADTYGALLEREVPVLADGPLYRLVHDDLSEFWHPLWFAEFAAHAAAPRARLRRRGRPLQPAHGDAARGRRARGLAARRRRPDRVRELHRPADRAPLPPERALPRAAPRRRGRARAGAHRAAALGGAPEGRAARGRPRRRRLRRARSLPPAHARLRRAARTARRRPRRRSPRRCSTASAASG